MSLSIDLQKLPPQALDVIRFLDGRDDGASVDAILAGTGLSERAFGKSIRRLVTRYYVELRDQGVYALTRTGREAAQEIRAYDGTASPGWISESPAEAESSALHMRQLSVWAAQAIVAQGRSVLLVGFDAPRATVPLGGEAHLTLRLSAPGCEVEPEEHPLDMLPDKPAGPVQFRVMPHQEGPLQIRIEVFQYLTEQEGMPLGGMYFEIEVVPFPTPRCVEFQALGAPIGLFPT
jgi:hypothetical protein